MERIDHVTEELLSYYSNGDQFPSCVNLIGRKAGGKSVCLQNFLFKKRDEIVSVVVFGNECYTSKILFETIVNTFRRQLTDKNNDVPNEDVDNIEEFLSKLIKIDKNELLKQSYLIAIESAEKLRDMKLNIIPVFTKLQELTGLNISCVFISHIPLSKFGLSMPKINIPDYSKNDLNEILSSKYPKIHNKLMESVKLNVELNEEDKEKELRLIEKLDESFYKNYLNIFLNVFYKICRDTTELQFLARECYPAYYTPVLKGEIMISDVRNLWRNINKALKISLKTSHMRIENLNYNEVTTNSIMEPVKENSIREFAQTLELPYYAKYLLIASFLASHNDAKYDKRLFMKHHGKEKKRKQIAKVSERMNIQFGPKSFTIDRLLAIFYAIMDEKVGLTCNLLSQISTLVDLNFLTFVSGENCIMEGNARLQSTIGLDFAINIGKVVGFNVKQFLTDFH